MNPWAFSKADERLYLTPEDVSKAIKAGCSVETLLRAVLEAVESRAVEDASCCAFVALEHCRGNT